MWIFELAILNRFQLIHDDDLTFNSKDTEINSPTFHTWGLNSIHTWFPIMTSNAMGTSLSH